MLLLIAASILGKISRDNVRFIAIMPMCDQTPVEPFPITGRTADSRYVMNCLRWNIHALLMCVTSLIVSVGTGADIRVPEDAPTIKAALEQAADGDRIDIAE